jgi:hypothetical protein
MVISFFNNLEEVKDLSSEAATAMSMTYLMGCDCIKSTMYCIACELGSLPIQVRWNTANAKDILNKNYDRILFKKSST